MRIKSAAFITALNNELADRRRRISNLKKERMKEVLAVIPQLGELDESTSMIAFDLGRKLIGAKDSKELLRVAETTVAERTAERCRLLTEHGFPADYLEPEYICPICRDTGRVHGELCQCVTQLAVRTAFEDSGLDPEQSFDNFDLSLQSDLKNRSAMQKILAEAIEYADSFSASRDRDLIYFGKSGVGKTYLLNCIGGRILKRGFSVLKLNAYRLIQMTLDNLRSSPEDKPNFTLPDLLIVDDLGTEPMIENITVETLLSILCDRQGSGKATLFATNLNVVSEPGGNVPSFQDFYGERFSTRLFDPRRAKVQLIRTENVRMKS